MMQVVEATNMGEHAELRQEFADDPWLTEVVEALTNADMPDIRTRCRARHCALNFAIQDGKLWHIRTKAKDRVAKVECVSKEKGLKHAMEVHERNGHFGWDHTQL